MIYVLGFCVNTAEKDKGKILLMQRTKNDRQKGFYNGIGGKIEPEEGAYEAMIREFHEEAGIQTIKSDWRLFGSVGGEHWKARLFVGAADLSTHSEFNEEGRLELISPDRIGEMPVVDNLKWIVPMALSKSPVFVTATEIREESDDPVYRFREA